MARGSPGRSSISKPLQIAVDNARGTTGYYAVLACPKDNYWRLPVAPNMSTHARCHCSASFIHTSIGFPAAAGVAVRPGKEVSFDSIDDGDAVIGFGNLSCSSQGSIIWSIALTWMSAALFNCVRAASTTCVGHPSVFAATAIWSMTRSAFLWFVSAISFRQVANAFKAAFAPSRASLVSLEAATGLKARGLVSRKPTDLICSPRLNFLPCQTPFTIRHREGA